MPSVLKCPSCHRPLSCAVEVVANVKTIYVYCSYGPCHPPELGDGVPGATVEESYAGLEDAYREFVNNQPQ